MTTFKEVFDTKINSQDIKNHVLYHQNRPNLKLVIACFALLICGLALKKDPVIIMDEDKIIINTLDQIGLARLDVDVKIVAAEILQDYPFISQLLIDESFQKETYALYGRKNRDTEVYDQLNSYVIHYENDSQRIHLAFSPHNEPVRDYFIDSDHPKISYINDHEIVIYQYKQIYLTTFMYNGIYFDIETSNVEISALIDLLNQIIQ